MGTLDLAVVGLNHTTAPIAVRERATVRDDEREAILAHLRRHAREVMLLATCNRTEVYLAGIGGDPLSAFEGAWGHLLREYLYVYQGEEAARHLYQVAAGLDSLVIGETQIQGQVKRAWQDASKRGDTAALLNKATQGALNAGKRVRFETGLSDKVVSVRAPPWTWPASTWAISGRTALIVGAGETAELTLTHLRAAGVQDIIVVNRTAERAQQLADKLGGRACAHEYLQEVLPEADVVIASSAAPHYVLGASGVADALSTRFDRPMMLIDISVPRILNPDIGGVTGAHLFNLDDLQGVVSRNLASRRAALPQAGLIVEEAVAELVRWQDFRQSHGLARPAAHDARLPTACD